MKAAIYTVIAAIATGFVVAPAAGESETRRPMASVISRDGVKIAFEKTGRGPAVILIGGALSDRKGGKALATKLAENFTVTTYDRRGRGDSADAKAYAVEREIDDIAALIADTGGSANLYGVSSGAALALQATARLGPTKVQKLAIYEPPYGPDEPKHRADFAEQKQRVNLLIKTGQPGEAASYFMTAIGTPPDALEKLKSSPQWDSMAKIDFTLAYDYVILGDGTIPEAVVKSIAVPTLVIEGEKTLEFMHATADRIAALISGAGRRTLEGQTHQASPEVVAPILTEFFKSP